MTGDIVEEIAVVKRRSLASKGERWGIVITLWLRVAFRQDRGATDSPYQKGRL